MDALHKIVGLDLAALHPQQVIFPLSCHTGRFQVVRDIADLQPDQSFFIERAAEAYGKKGKIEAQHLAFELTELFASGELTPQDMDGIMYEMHKAYFKYREQKREKERIMNL